MALAVDVTDAGEGYDQKCHNACFRYVHKDLTITDVLSRALQINQ